MAVPSKDFLVNLFSAVGTVFTFVQLRVARREAERAQRESKEGRIQAAADCMMQPMFPTEKRVNEVAGCRIIEDIRRRIRHWNQHATIIAGRFGSAKSHGCRRSFFVTGRLSYVSHRSGRGLREFALQRPGPGQPGHVEGCPAPGQKAEPRVNPHPRVGHSSVNQGRRDIGDFGCFVFDSRGLQAWAAFPPLPRLSRRTVRWPHAGKRRLSRPVFAMLR